jgi:hypothetical protein
MSFGHLGIALGFSLLIASAGAAAQPPDDGRSTLQAELRGREFFTVTRVDPDGTILLEPAEATQPELRKILGSGFAEGFYVLLTNDSRPGSKLRVLRVQVTDVAAGPVFTLKTGPAAASRVRINDSARLVRPAPVTTAGLRALPDEVPLQGLSEEGNAEDARELESRARSVNNLKQMALAMHNFESTNGEFPPAVIYGPDGKPWHSWRVLILPYVEHLDLYNAYDFSQPWDSPRNKALLDKMPSVYRDPIHGESKEPYTHYAALVGPDAIFLSEGARQTDPKQPPIGKGGVSIRSITDGTSNTVMISSVDPGRKIPWTKPEDIDVGPGFKGIGSPGGIAAPYKFRGSGGGKAALFAFADGSVRVIGATVNPRVLAALLTRAAGEVMTSDSYPSEASPFASVRRTLKIHIVGGKATAVIE